MDSVITAIIQILKPAVEMTLRQHPVATALVLVAVLIWMQVMAVRSFSRARNGR